MTVAVRHADAADEAVLLAFLRALQDAERALSPSRRPGHEVERLYYDRLRTTGSHILIAERAGRAVGFVAGRRMLDDDDLQVMAWRAHGYVSDLFVVADQRGRGVAQVLLSAIAERLRAEGARRLRIGSLSANAAALAAYRRFGFRPFEIVLDLELD